MTPKLKIFLLVTPLVVLLDQFTKYLVNTHLAPYASITVVENFIHLSHVRNPGGAFGVLSWVGPNFFVVIAGLAIGVVFIFFWSLGRDQRLPATALSLILGGAVGNLADRVRLGSVVDFIDVHWHSLRWPAFNVADAAITVGVVLLVVELLTTESHKRQELVGESAPAD
ncbi:MAG: signal peptidase II [Deltaproteobacteria bacterium]|nr:signal peptidase II [Deltaproteobacteria bacterium]